MNVRELVVGSGGVRGAVALGAVHHLTRHGILDRVTVFSGTSIGAVIAAGLVLGISPLRMLRTAIRHPLKPDISPNNFGVDSGKGLVVLIRRMLRLDRRTTFRDVHESTGKTLRVCVCNLTDRNVEYWSHHTHPDTSVLQALRISCSIPLVFAGVDVDGKMYVDGAVADPLPVLSASRTLAIGFRIKKGTVATMQDFVEAIHASRIPPPTPKYFLELDPGDLDPFDFGLDADAMHKAFAEGQTQASNWTKKNV